MARWGEMERQGMLSAGVGCFQFLSNRTEKLSSSVELRTHRIYHGFVTTPWWVTDVPEGLFCLPACENFSWFIRSWRYVVNRHFEWTSEGRWKSYYFYNCVNGGNNCSVIKRTRIRILFIKAWRNFSQSMIKSLRN